MKIYLSILIMLCCTNNLFAVWKSIEGPYNSNIHCLCASENKIFAGTMDGLLISTDSGNSWFESENELSGKKILSIKNMNNGNLIASTTNEGIFISSDGGDSWNSGNNGLSGESLTIFKIYVENQKIYIATRGGIYVSDNNAESWTNITGNLQMDMATNVAAIENIILAGATQGLHISKDGGKNWMKIEHFADYNVVESINIFNNSIYVSARVAGWVIISGLFVSNDYGNSWTDISMELFQNNFHDIFIDEDTVYAATDEGLFKTAADKIEWNNITKDSIENKFLFMIGNENLSSIIQHNDIIFIGTNGGIFQTTDKGETWITNTPVLSNKEVNEIEMINDEIYVGTKAGLYKSTDFGKSWYSLSQNIGMRNVISLFIEDNLIYIGTTEGLFLSSDNGNSWVGKNKGMLTETGIYKILKVANILFAGTYTNGIYSSSDMGESWIQMNNGISDPRIYCLNNIGNNIFAGITNIHPGFYHSEDLGNTWKSSSFYKEYEYFPWVYSIVTREINLFIGTGWNGIYKSDDMGITWQAKNNGPNDMKSHDVFSVALKDNFLIATSKAKNEIHNKLILSTDSGDNWVYSNTAGIENQNIRELYIKDDYVFAGARGSFSPDLNETYSNIMGGFYYTKISNLINETSVDDKSLDMNDLHIFPNPTTDFITIQISEVFESSEVSEIKIFNMLGECVISESIHPMTASHRMNIEKLSAGVYLLRIGDNVKKFVKK